MTETEFIDAVREMQNDPLKVLFVFTCPTRQGTARYLNGFVQWRRNGSEYYSFPIEDADFLQQLDAGSPTKG